MFQVVPNAISEWQLALNVKRANGPIRLNRKCANNQYFLVDEDPNEQVILLITFITQASTKQYKIPVKTAYYFKS